MKALSVLKIFKKVCHADKEVVMDIDEAIAELEGIAELTQDKNTLEQLCFDFMNTWDKCSAYPDTQDDIGSLDSVYHKMYEHIFGIKDK